MKQTYLTLFFLSTLSLLAEAKEETPSSLSTLSKEEIAKQSIAATPAATRIGVIDVQYILRNSVAFQKAQSAVEAKVKVEEKEFQDLQKNLEKEYHALMALQSAMDKKPWTERKKAFDKKVADLQQKLQQRRQGLEASYNRMVLELQTHVQKILSSLSVQYRFSLILDKQFILWYSPDMMDLTEEVTKLLNERVPAIPLAGNPSPSSR